MAIDSNFKEQMLSLTTTLHSNASRDLADIDANVRWFTTLVLASIAALAGYRQLQGAESLSPHLALIVLMLCISLLMFVFAVLIAQIRRASFSRRVAGFIEKIHELDRDDQMSPQGAKDELQKQSENLRKSAFQLAKHPDLCQFYGLLLFVLSSVVATFFILFEEVFIAILA
ncbi:hypothetical protein [Halomonas sp. DN3]|uniref:hypothetical protein n=1 Tax=Halomonas sp. DN3 TaxID=2953657 RepID=UPI0020A1D36C|nr:hypothetical protein [Halomonas sp. DN3]USZ51073.1 hypothetical protein NKF27_06120 [Halomonas sp. DN3]